MAEEVKKEVTEGLDKAAAAGDAPEVGKMKRGDYMIHVFIEQARQMKVPEGNTVDPMFEVSCMGVRKFTSAKDDISGVGLCTWNEHLFFEPKNVQTEDIEQAKITIRLLDKGYFKDALIGMYEFDIAFIYFMKQHSLMHRWLALSNPNSASFNEVTGYLKLSITIAATGDEQVQITDDNGADKSDQPIMMPPSIKPEYYQLRFKFFKAEKLPAMDMGMLGRGGSIDAYIICNYMNKKIKTSVKLQKEGGSLEWDQQFLIPCQLPIMSSRIVMKVYDQDNITDEIVGSLLFNIKDCIGPLNGKYFWKNVYGSPLGCSGENTNLMNENPELGSTWKGRILIQVSAQKTEKPQLIVENLKPEEKVTAAIYMKDHEFEIIAEVGQGIGLPLGSTGIGALSISSSEKYSVMIKIGDLELKSDKAVTVENNYNRWNFRFKQTSYIGPYQDISDIGQVFVYLMLGDKPICYYRSNIENFTNPNPQFQWIQLLPDLALGKVTQEHKAGLVSVKIAIHDKTINGPINYADFDAWKKPPPKRLGNFKVRAFVFQCRDLPAADSDGQSDPYIRIWDTDKVMKKTQIIEDNLNPLFYETLELQFEGNKVEELPPFICDIYDWDLGPLEDDYIARAVIPIKDCSYSTDSTVPRPKWHPCKIKAGAPNCGEVLISFSIVPLDFNYATPLSYMRISDTVESQEFIVSINILGLRNLQSAGILPVKKAFLQFNLKSLVPPEIGSALENLKTQPGDAGPNPTINTLIKFTLPLPTDPLFCPKLTCQVYDYIFKGLSQPMIGAFVIPIGDCIHALRKEREEETNAIKNILSELDKIIIDMGAISYNLQEEIKEDFENESVKSTTKVVAALLRQSMKGVDPELTTPFINSIINNSKDDQFKMMVARTNRTASQPWTPSRITPKHLMQMSGSPDGAGEKKARNNTFKTMNDFDKFGSGMKDQLMKDTKDQAERAKREHEDIRQREQEEFRQKNNKAVKNVLKPTYELDKRLSIHREVKPPPESLFMALGWDDKPDAGKRHYRRYYPDELENIKSVMPTASPFMTYEIKKGQSRGAGSSWWPFKAQGKQDESGEATTEQIMGIFKGIVSVQTHQDKHEYKELKKELIHQLKVKLNQLSLRKTQRPLDLRLDSLDTMEGRHKFEHAMRELGVDHLEISKHLADLESDVMLERMLMCQTKCVVRVYMISAYDLASRDNGSFSDPYLKISLGNKTYNERSIYQLDEPNPEFNKYYDFEATFPGCAPLVIDVVDFDDIFGDDSIGVTILDLEDRFFCPSWQSIKRKPIEYRQLYHPSSAVSQGVVKMWVEIIPTSIPQKDVPVYDLTPRAAEELEVRLVIWDTMDVECMDIEGTSDVYCRAFFDSKEENHETDTHYRCQNGKASFNYRLIYTVKHPRKDYNFTLQVYDRDFFKSNDIIGEAIIDLANLFEDSSLTGKPLDLDKRYFNDYLKPRGMNYNFKDDKSFWVSIIGIDDKGETKETGKVRISLQVLPKKQAEANKVGEARQEPNHSPFLPPPIGRLSFSLNPLKMFQQLVGPAMRRKIYCICCLVICVALCVALLPLILGNLISSLFVKIIG